MKNVLSRISIALLVVIIASSQIALSQNREDMVEGVIKVKFDRQLAAKFQGVDLPYANNLVTETGVASVDNFNNNLQIEGFTRLFPFSPKHEARHRKHGLHLWYEIKFDPLRDPVELIAQYKELEGVEMAIPALKKVRIDADSPFSYFDPLAFNQEEETYPFDDPFLPDQWHYENFGDLEGSIEDADIDLFGAWDVNTGDSKVIVSVVDGGVDLAHEDIKDNLWINEAELNGEPGVDDDQNGYVDDIHGYNFAIGGTVTATMHGTHVAGTVAATTNNGVGVAGVAGGDGSGNGARIMSCQVYVGNISNGFSRAIVYGADNGALISQNSWGYTQPGYFEQDVLDAIDYFIDEAGQYEGSLMKGGLVFFAAGNTGANELHYPGAYESAVAVAASAVDNFPAPYTTHGDWVDITAPGGYTNGLSLETQVLSTLPGNQYGYFQGTSMACPHVSGVAALVISEFGGENFTAEEAKDRILNLVEPFRSDQHPYYNGVLGAGLLNANNSLLTDAGVGPEQVTDLRADSIYHDSFDLVWTIPVDEDDEKPNHFYIWLTSSAFEKADISNIQPFAFLYDGDAGDQYELEIMGARPQTTYYSAIMSVDRWGNESELSEILSLTTDEAPYFSLDSLNLTFNIDVSQNGVEQEYITMRNEKGGVLRWSSTVKNKSFEGPELSNVIAQPVQTGYSESGTPWIKFNSLLNDYGKPGYGSIADLNSTGTLSVEPLSVEDSLTADLVDNTQFTSGLYHDPDQFPDLIFGVYGETVSFAHATRFQVPLDYYINVTHVAAMIWPDVDYKPIIVEIRKGGNKPDEGELVYIQEYTPTTTELGWQYIPLAKPQIFEHGEIFWIVMHHPREESLVITGNWTPSFPGDAFYLSMNSGRNWEPVISQLTSGFGILKVRAYSVGGDPSYLYLDPVEGEIMSGDSTVARVVADGRGLRNGLHKTALNIYTNDTDYPGATIYIDVNVTGQESDLKYEGITRFDDVFTGQVSKQYIQLENSGLAAVRIDSITSSNAQYSVTIPDSLWILPTYRYDLPVTLNLASSGLHQGSIVLHTNDGPFSIEVSALGIDAPSASISPTTASFTTAVDTPTNGTFTIMNDGGYPLEFHIPADYRQQAEGQINYSVIDSDSIGGPVAGYFEDISHFGINVVDTVLGGYASRYIDLGFDFPFYDEVFNKVRIHSDGGLFFGESFGFKTDSLPGESHGEGVIGPFLADIHPIGSINHLMPPGGVYYAKLGNRLIVQWDNVPSIRANMDGRVTFQVVLFDNGDIEFRYSNVEESNYFDRALVGIQNISETRGITYQSENSVTRLKDGLVVRFMRSEGDPFITDLSHDYGILPVGASLTVDYAVDPGMNRLLDGTYLQNLRLFTNAGTYTVPINLTVIGTPETELVDSSVSFEDVMITKESLAQFKVRNTGTKSYWINSVTIDTSSFELRNVPLPVEIGPNAEHAFLLAFLPQVAGNYSGQLILQTDIGTDLIIDLQGIGLPSPDFAVDLQAIDLTINANEEFDQPLQVTNTSGNAELDYTVYAKGFAKTSQEGLVKLNGQSGYGPYGYSWIDNVDGSEVLRFAWEDIVSDSTRLMVPDDGFVKMNIGFDFPYFGQLFDSLWLNENGYLTLIEPESLTDPMHHSNIAKDDGVRASILGMKAYWTLSDSEPESGIYVHKTDERIIIQYNVLRNTFKEMPGNATFQIILQNDGRIRLQFLDVAGFNGEFNYGLESPDEEYVLDLGRPGYDFPEIFEDYPIYDELAVLLTPPVKGRLQTLGSAAENIVISSKDLLDGGPYLDTVTVRTNSVITPEIRIPVSLSVNGMADLAVDKDTIDFGEIILFGGQTYGDSLLLSNNGTKVSVVRKLVFENLNGVNLFTAAGQKILTNSNDELYIPISIEPRVATNYYLGLDPQALGLVSGRLRIITDEQEIIVELRAVIVEPPSITVESSVIDYQIGISDSLVHNIEISNPGKSSLHYEMWPVYKIVPGAIPNENVIVEEIEELSFSDSLHLDVKNTADRFWSALGGRAHSHAMKFEVPESGFVATHASTLIQFLDDTTQFRIKIYQGGELESGKKFSGGELIHDEYFNEVVPVGVPHWVQMTLSKNVILEPGSVAWFIIYFPPLYNDIGMDTYPLHLEEGVNFTSGGSFEVFYDNFTGGLGLSKMRLLQSSSDAGWLELTPRNGTIEAGESVTVDAKLLGPKAMVGLNKASINIRTNDPVQPLMDLDADLLVNGPPFFTYTPNTNGYRLKVKETEKETGNLYAEDLENEEVTFRLAEEDHPFAAIQNLGDGLGQIVLTPGFEDSGKHEIEVLAEDASGNARSEFVQVMVEDKNRPALIDSTYYIVMDVHQDLFRVDFDKIFTDPDNDSLYFGAYNYDPDIIEFAMGAEEMVIIPKQPGEALTVFMADDLKEDGFVYTFMWVVVEEKPLAVGEELRQLDVKLYPNPATDFSTVEFFLQREGEVRIEVFDMAGIPVDVMMDKFLNRGSNSYTYDVTRLPDGIYIYRIIKDDQVVATVRAVVTH